MTTAEQLIQLTEIISNLGKDISNVEESKKTASSKELPELEQLQQHLENSLQELKNQLQNLISEK
jgi:peptidoglycan hydrolase CwlO-like protein